MPDAPRIRLLAALAGAAFVLVVPPALGQSLYDRQAELGTRMSVLREDIEKVDTTV